MTFVVNSVQPLREHSSDVGTVMACPKLSRAKNICVLSNGGVSDMHEETLEPTEQTTTNCFYCGEDKPRGDFSDEHIWPDALGGDFLPRFWRTNAVCARCNSIAGVFVDGAFIRGWAGSRERGEDARHYLSLDDPAASVLPLSYLGRPTDPRIAEDEIVEWWAGPCGATILHFRPKTDENLWSSYLGGDPRLKKNGAGRAYMAMASAADYWVVAALVSFGKHFKRAKRRLVNMEVPPEWKAFEEIDRTDPLQAADLQIMDSMFEAARRGQGTRARLPHLDASTANRLLCKLGLAIGCQLFGGSFGSHADGADLRRAFREADPGKRAAIPVRGSGYYSARSGNPLSGFAWPAGWVLILNVIDGKFSLAVIAPSGAVMSILITEDAALLSRLPPEYDEGQLWVTVPPIGKAAGPISLPDYVAHCAGFVLNADLAAMAAARIDPADLPACTATDSAETVP